MPRATSPTPPPTKRDPYPDSDMEDIKPSPKKVKSTKAAPRAWTGDELDTLFTIALTIGASKANYEGKIEGRTGLQCLKTWENTLLPYLHKMAREKNNKKGH